MFMASDYQKYYQVNRGDVVFDLGAFNGRHTIQYSAAVGNSGLVVAVEAGHDSYIKLLHLIAEYRLINVLPLNVAISSEAGLASFNITDDFLGAACSLSGKNIDVTKIQKVLTLSLADLISLVGVKTVDFLKCDIEGSEIELLSCDPGAIRKVRNWAVGSYHIRDGRPTTVVVESRLRDAGFQVITEPGDVELGFTDEVVTYASLNEIPAPGAIA